MRAVPKHLAHAISENRVIFAQKNTLHSKRATSFLPRLNVLMMRLHSTFWILESRVEERGKKWRSLELE